MSDLGRLTHGRSVVGEVLALRVANARSIFNMEKISHRASLCLEWAACLIQIAHKRNSGTWAALARCSGSPTCGAIMGTENGHTVETAVEARAGFLDRPVLAVLIVSTALMMVAFVLVFWGVVKF